MKWTYIIQNKLRAAFMLFIVIVLVLINNFNERNRLDKISRAIHSIYEDRLIAEHYTFQYLQYSQEIIEISAADDNQAISIGKLMLPILDHARSLDTAYLKTTLTKEEQREFSNLLALYDSIEIAVERNDRATVNQKGKETLSILDALSDIQIKEGALQMKVIDKLYSSAALSSNFEFAVLIIIGLIIQALVFSSKTLQVKMPNDKHNLN